MTGASPAEAAASPPLITSISRSKVAAEVNFQTLVTGLPVLFAGKAALVLPSGTYTLAQLTPTFHQAISAIEATKAAEVQYHDTVAAEQVAVAAAVALRKEVKQVAVGQFGATSSTLAQLSFTPAKPRQVSAATKAASAAKALATRKAKKASPPPAPAAPPPAPKPGS